MSIRTTSTILLQIVCEIMLSFLVIVKSIKYPDDFAKYNLWHICVKEK